MVDGFAVAKRLCSGLLIAALVVISVVAGAADSEPVRIGVLAKGSEVLTMQRWPATADYLQSKIPEYRFEIVPLGFHQIEPAVKQRQIDFLLANPASFVEMESDYGVSAVLMLNRRLSQDDSVAEFAGVVFTAAGHDAIADFSDLKGKSIIAVDATSFGGWAMAWREMKRHGIEPFEDLAAIEFAGSHEAVVFAVLAGKADVGTVRSGILERLVSEGRLDLDQLQVLSHQAHGYQESSEFPLLHSTTHYPEWPLAILGHVDRELAGQVVKAMLEIKATDKPALAAKISHWTPAVNYLSVHQLMQDLHIAKYQGYGEVGLLDAVRQHWRWAVAVLSVLLLLSLFAFYVLRLNLRIGTINQALKKEVSNKLTAQSELLAETEKANKILDNMLEGVVTIDRAGLIQTFNQAAERIFSYQNSEVLGQNVRLLMPKVDALMHDRHLENYVTTKKSKIIGFGREVFGQRKNGESFPLEISVSEVIASGERMFIAVMRDLSETKQAEQKIMRLVSAMRCAVEGIFIADVEGCIEYVNPAYEMMTGESQAELEKRKPAVFEMAERNEPCCVDLFEKVQGGEPWSGQYTLRRNNGDSYEEEVTISPVLDDNGGVICFVGVCRDITEKLARDQRLQQLEKFEVVSKMAGGFAHDFNNLLSAIVGYAGMALLDIDKDSEPAADMARVLDAAGRAKLLVQKLLVLSRQDYDDALVFMPQKTVHEVVALLRAVLPADAVINADVQEDAGEIYLSPQKFQQIVMNLGLYAIDTMAQKNGCIDLSLSSEVLTQQQPPTKEGLVAGEYVVMRLSNNGTVAQADILELGYTAHDNVGTQSMWLAVVHGIVSGSKGCLEVESVPGEGLSLAVYLPCAHHHQRDR